MKIIAKAVNRASIEPRPESRLADRNATHFGQSFVVVGRPRDHVDVRVDVVHEK